MILLYPLLHGHPAASPCEQFLRSRREWFTTPLTLVEARNVLAKYYGVSTGDATAKLVQLAAGPIAILDLDKSAITAALQMAETERIDVTDAVLLQLSLQERAHELATEDHRLDHRHGISPISPFDAAVRQQVATWEAANLKTNGLPRSLHRVHHWLSTSHAQAAQDFWSQTGGGQHLP